MEDGYSLAGVKVLLLEDDYYLAEDATHALRDAGAEVLGPFSDGEAAVQAAHSGRPKCALLDVNLGAGPDFSPARAIEALGISVIFLTGYDDGVIPGDLRGLPCLQKPVGEAKLLKAVRDICCH